MGDWTFFSVCVILAGAIIGAILLCIDDEPEVLSKDERRRLSVLRGHPDVAYPMSEPYYGDGEQEVSL